MSNYCIVYSIHSDKKDIDNLLQWRELLYSVKTLRSFNKDVKIKLYVSPPEAIDSITMFPDMENLEIIPTLNPEGSYSVLGHEVARWMDMKYNAAFHALENSSYDNVLMIDPDTIYYNNPDLILDKCSNDEFWSTPDIYPEFFAYLKTNKTYMNDGVVIVPRWSLTIKDSLLFARDNFIINIASKYKDVLSDEDVFWRNGIGWSSTQYGVFDHLLEIERPIKYFDVEDVANLPDWNSEQPPIILHYWHVGSRDHLPKEYWSGLEDTHMTRIHAKV
jgi:hypothetical protein